MFSMVIGTALHIRNPELASAGLIFYLLVFYMVTLAADTVLLLAQAQQPLAPTAPARKPTRSWPILTKNRMHTLPGHS